MISLNIRIPESLARRLSVLASQTGRTKSYYVREALQDKLEALEEFYLAAETAEQVAIGKMRTWSQAEIEKDCDLGD